MSEDSEQILVEYYRVDTGIVNSYYRAWVPRAGDYVRMDGDYYRVVQLAWIEDIPKRYVKLWIEPVPSPLGV